MQDELKGRAGELRVNTQQGRAVWPATLSEDLDWGSGSITVTLDKPLNSKKSFFTCKTGVMTSALPGPGIPASLKEIMPPGAWLPTTSCGNKPAGTGAGIRRSKDVL